MAFPAVILRMGHELNVEAYTPHCQQTRCLSECDPAFKCLHSVAPMCGSHAVSKWLLLCIPAMISGSLGTATHVPGSTCGRCCIVAPLNSQAVVGPAVCQGPPPLRNNKLAAAPYLHIPLPYSIEHSGGHQAGSFGGWNQCTASMPPQNCVWLSHAGVLGWTGNSSPLLKLLCSICYWTCCSRSSAGLHIAVTRRPLLPCSPHIAPVVYPSPSTLFTESPGRDTGPLTSEE